MYCISSSCYSLSACGFYLLFVFKAFCETLEETNYRFQKELLEKQKELESLKKLLSEKQLLIDTLENRIRYVLWTAFSVQQVQLSTLD